MRPLRKLTMGWIQTEIPAIEDRDNKTGIKIFLLVQKICGSREIWSKLLAGRIEYVQEWLNWS